MNGAAIFVFDVSKRHAGAKIDRHTIDTIVDVLAGSGLHLDDRPSDA